MQVETTRAGDEVESPREIIVVIRNHGNRDTWIGPPNLQSLSAGFVVLRHRPSDFFDMDLGEWKPWSQSPWATVHVPAGQRRIFAFNVRGDAELHAVTIRDARGRLVRKRFGPFAIFRRLRLKLYRIRRQKRIKALEWEEVFEELTDYYADRSGREPRTKRKLPESLK